MSDTYWWLLYALAGAAVAWTTLQYLIKHGADDTDLQTESLVRYLAQHPGLKAYMLLATWALWPVVLAAMLSDGVRWLYYGFRDRIDDLLDWWDERDSTRKEGSA